MTTSTANRILKAIQRQETARGTFIPELNKYRLKLHFPELTIGKTTIPAGCSKDTIWASSPLDAMTLAATQWRMAEWVEVVQ